MFIKWYCKEIDFILWKWFDRLFNRYDYICSLSFKLKFIVFVVWCVFWFFCNVNVFVDGLILIFLIEELKINKLLIFYVDVYLYEYG